MSSACFSLLSGLFSHDPTGLAISDLRTGERSTFGDLVAATARIRRSLTRQGLRAGDVVGCTVETGIDLAAIVLACLESGYPIRLAEAGPSIAPAAADLPTLIVHGAAMPIEPRVRHVAVRELGQTTSAWGLPDPAADPQRGSITAPLDGTVRTMGAPALIRSVANLRATISARPGQTLLSLSAPHSLDGIVNSLLAPLAIGMHVTLADPRVLLQPGPLQAVPAFDWWEGPGPAWLELARAAAPRRLPAPTNGALCGSVRLHPVEAVEVEAALGFPILCGIGTAETGLWAVSTATLAQPGRAIATIRPLRSPLALSGSGGAAGGEIVLRDGADGAEHRTGLVGWSDPAQRIAAAGLLSDVVVRAGRATLLSDTDRLLSGNPAVCQSRTFRDTGLSPTEATTAVCLTTHDPNEIEAWLAAHAATEPMPDRIVAVSPDVAAELPPIATLRAVVGEHASGAVTAALTARRFRRNPAYDEAGLAGAVNRALLANQPLDFLMFWGCGPRRVAAAPDRAAVDALADLLAAAEAAAPLRARVRIVCTDLHATNNGHSEAHYSTYFGEIAALAAGLDVSFELESAVWRRGGLSKAEVCAFEQKPGFADRWNRFPLQARFVQQASRHSRMEDKIAAARHYYATCLLERDVLRTLFQGSVFLTYNGPEFNECFPDLPTLYVFPGPRGRTVKPWFIDVADAPPATPAVAAE